MIENLTVNSDRVPFVAVANDEICRINADGTTTYHWDRIETAAQRWEPGCENIALCLAKLLLPLRAALEQPEQAEPVAWIDNSGHPRHIRYWQSATEKRLYGPLRPLYERPPRCEPEPQPEPIHPDKIRAEFREMDRCCLPGEMTLEDWFTEGVRFAEKHNAQQ